MAGLRPFRTIPQNEREWARWCREQEDAIRDSASTAAASVDNTTVSGIELKNYDVTHEIATINSNAATVTYTTAQSWFVDLEPATGNVTITISGGPSAGTYGEINIKVQQDSAGSRTITWAGGTFQWAGGSAPTMTAAANAEDIFHFQTTDQGATWIGSVIQNVS